MIVGDGIHSGKLAAVEHIGPEPLRIAFYSIRPEPVDGFESASSPWGSSSWAVH